MPVIVQGTDSLTVPVGTTAQRNATPVQGMVRYNSTLGVKECYNGTNWVSDSVVSGTSVASTSGTSIDYTGIPAGVKRITVMFSGVSTNGSSPIMCQIGTASGVETTSYVCGSGADIGSVGSISGNSTTGFSMPNSVGSASGIFSGVFYLNLLGSNTWCGNGTFCRIDTNSGGIYLGGSKALASTLDRVRITTVNGTDTFDAGSINILYE